MEPVRLLRDYVRLDTTDETGEQKGAEFLQRFFDCAGIETEMVCPAPRRCNLLARLPGRSREGAILLVNHIDVAGFVPSYWKESGPFEGKIKLGFLYGRGAYDMKSLGLSEALAIRNLKRLVKPFPLILVLTPQSRNCGGAVFAKARRTGSSQTAPADLEGNKTSCGAISGRLRYGLESEKLVGTPFDILIRRCCEVPALTSRCSKNCCGTRPFRAR